MIHPSLIEKISLDVREGNRAVIDDLKRSYPYVGPVSVTTHAASDPVCNVMKLIVRMSKPYWAADEQGAQMWDAVYGWLDGKMYKVASTMANFNKSRAEKDQQTVTFDRLELDMKPYLFGMMLAGDDTLPEAEDLVGRFRELLNAGVIEGEVARVEMPSAASWAVQHAAAEEAMRAATAAEADASPKDAETEEAPIADRTPIEEETPAGDSEASAPCAAAGEPAKQPTLAPRVVVPAVDYTLWDVVFADGTVRQFDSVAGAWL